MENKVTQLKQLIESADGILITSHIGPDGDSVSSSLLAMHLLKLNYPEKKIAASFEEEPSGLDFLEGIKEIKIQPLIDSLNEFNPDLLMILDANTISRITREPEQSRKYLSDSKAKVVIIDHHEQVGVEKNDLYINNFSPAVTFDIYELFIEKMGLKKSDGYAQIAMTGIYTDTGGFVYRNLNYSKTFQAIPKLIADGADIEKVASEISRINDLGFEFFKVLMANMKLEPDHVFSYLDDHHLESNDAKTIEALKQALDIVRTNFLRNIGHRTWGFLVYRDILAPARIYSVSFRAISGTKDVSELASKLGGGGHKPAAGAKFEASSVEEAIKKVKAAIVA